MKRKDSNSGAKIKSIIDSPSGKVNFLRTDKTGRIYWIDPHKNLKK